MCMLPHGRSAGDTTWPRASSCVISSALNAPGSTLMLSGRYWWWKRGISAVCCALRPSMSSTRPSSTIVTIRLPPGVPSTATRCGPIRKVGDIEESGRLPGAIAFASSPTRPNAFGTPGFTEKSSIWSFSMKPVPGTIIVLPNGRFTVCVTAARLPSRSMIEKCVVSLPAAGASTPGSSALGIARSRLMPARRPAA